MKLNEITIRKCTCQDMNGIHALVKELADFEREPDAVITCAEIFKNDFKAGFFDCIVAEFNHAIIGIALYNRAYSTWKGRMLYLEDFYVQPEFRNRNIGQLLFDAFINEAQKEQAILTKWQVLDWNTMAQRFYEKNNCIIEKNWWNGKKFLGK